MYLGVQSVTFLVIHTTVFCCSKYVARSTRESWRLDWRWWLMMTENKLEHKGHAVTGFFIICTLCAFSGLCYVSSLISVKQDSCTKDGKKILFLHVAIKLWTFFLSLFVKDILKSSSFFCNTSYLMMLIDWHFIVAGNSTDCASESLFFACFAFSSLYVFKRKELYQDFFFNHRSVHSEIYIVYSPTNALFIKLGKV